MQLCFFITQNYYCTVRILSIKVTEMRANITSSVACLRSGAFLFNEQEVKQICKLYCVIEGDEWCGKEQHEED